ncbi:DUF3616 domain-containing protein [Rhizobium leguminosarum]|nr:DUF3616 domain-containing protein [Rhizobium leguminosarum]
MTTEFVLAGQIVLNYGSSEDTLLRNLSGCTVTRAALWTVADEGRTLERLTQRVDEFHLSARFTLDNFIQAIPGSADDELDLESLESDETSLWLCGAHCRVRRKPEPNEIINSDIRERKSRRVLARLPLDDTGTQPVGAQFTPFEGIGSLRSILEENAFLTPFRELPTKENGIDIEGLAVIAQRVFVGLRGPVVGGLAVVVELSFDKNFTITAARPYFLNLSGLGVRELTHDGDDLLVLAGPVGEAQGPFALYRWTPGSGHVPRKVYAWGTSIEKPEGLCWCQIGGERGLLVLYDSPGDARINSGSYKADWLKLSSPH